jgi:ubiquinone/menaquinone biosynthesis C-methylase UbiE
MSSISFDRAADIYDATRGYSPAVADAIGAALCDAAGTRPGSRWLEIGIGTGRIAVPLLARGAAVTGVDISPRMLERLRVNVAARRAAEPDRPWGTLDVRIADMTELPFADGAFDAVVAVHVLHLVTTWQQALDEALRVLRPGGPLLIGGDAHPGAESRAIEREWVAIAQNLGANVSRPGAANHEAVFAELRRRNLTVEPLAPVVWTDRTTPRAALDQIARRVWSRTWAVPDDLFAESVRRLEQWAHYTYGAALDTPREEPSEFGVVRVVKPA